jgi:glycosyltransferase involved in cell wall biosynthesis
MKQLSVCIPVYNNEVHLLVKALCDDAPDEVCEILLLDDGSSNAEVKKRNRALEKMLLVRYEELPENVGRAAVRNRLGEMAKGDFILFLDNDVLPLSEGFLSRYITKLGKAQVLCGGLEYPQSEVLEEGCELHHCIGTFSESKSAKERNETPNRGFHSSNFVIERSLFLSIRFDETLRQYGHEDTLFGYELSKRGVRVKHVENAVLHEDLESNATYLRKTDKALENLVLLFKREGPAFVESVRLLEGYERLKKARLLGLCKLLYNTSHQRLREKLLSDTPTVSAYKRYKLLRFCSLMQTA